MPDTADTARPAKPHDTAQASVDTLQTGRMEPPPGRRVKRGGALAARPVAHGGTVATSAADGTAASLARADRDATVLRLARDGWSLRAIAGRLGIAHETARQVLVRALAERQSLADLEAEQLRSVVADRLDDSRRRLLTIARGEPQPVGGRDAARARQRGEPIPCAVPTVQERIAAERSLAAIEEQRARLLGLNKAKETADVLGDFLAQLVTGGGSEGAADSAQVGQGPQGAIGHVATDPGHADSVQVPGVVAERV